MKKILSVLLAAMMVVSLAACGQKAATSNTQSASGSKTVKVGVCIYKFDDAFMTLYRNELDKYFKSKSNADVTYEVTIMDGKNDQAAQTNQIDNFIVQGYDVLILNLVQSSGAATIMQKCKDANIPVVFINREPSEADMNANNTGDYAGKFTYVGADARQSGKFQGELIADLPNKGDLNGDGKLQYVMIEGDPENVDAKYRTQFSISQYKEKAGLEVEQLLDQVGMWDRAKGQQIAQDALTQFADQIEVIFCNNDDMALGAKASIEAAGRKIGEDIYLVGVDALAEAVQAVMDGAMTGTVLNDHVGQSHTAVDCAIDAANGKSLQLYNWVDYVKVTPENASQYK